MASSAGKGKQGAVQMQRGRCAQSYRAISSSRNLLSVM